jgi:hypothetical protein
MFIRVWAVERDLVTILVSAISYLMYISVIMDYVTILNLSSILSSNSCNFHTDFDLLSFFLFTLASEERSKTFEIRCKKTSKGGGNYFSSM